MLWIEEQCPRNCHNAESLGVSNQMFRRDSNGELNGRTETEKETLTSLLNFHRLNLDNFGRDWNFHTNVTMQRQTLSRVLHYNYLYQKILNTPGVILEFGVQFGATLSLLMSLRGIYEPFNHRRHIVGFDTFEGFKAPNKMRDGDAWQEQDYRVPEGYEDALEKVLDLHELNCPISNLKKFTLVKGDASETVPQWVEENPHAIIALAIFDMDLYQPTKDALKAIKPLLTKGSVLVFDELNVAQFPGETEAVRELLSTSNVRLQRTQFSPNSAWMEW